MRLSTTLTLLLLTAGLGWFVAREDFARSEVAGPDSRRLFDLDKSQADRIEISGAEEKIILQRRGADWWLSSPIKDRANPLPAGAILEILRRMENIGSLPREEFTGARLRQAGLSEGAITLFISGAGTKLVSCKIGAPTPLENSVYVAIPAGGSRPSLHAARLPFAELGKSQETAARKLDFSAMLRADAEDWRDPVLIRVPVDKIRRLAFSAGSGIMELKREPGRHWELAKPLQTRASDERVSAVLAALLRLEVRAAGKPPETVTPAATDALPGMKVSFEIEGQDRPLEAVLQPGADPQAPIQATVSDRPGTFLAPPQAALIWKLQPNDLRDTRLARLDPEKINGLRIRSAAHPEIVLDRQGDTWMLTRLGRAAPANQDRVHQLFGELNAAQIREFAADAANNFEPFGLHQPFLVVEWREPGKSTELRFGLNAANQVHCQYDHEPFIYRVSPSLPGAIPTDAVKWQSLGILNLSTLTVRRIHIAEGTSPTVTLSHDGLTGAWRGEIAGQDVTDRIARDKAAALLGKLAGLTADTWVTDRTAGYEALKNPALTVQLQVADPAKPDATTVAHTLTFASTSPGSPGAAFYGRLDENPDLFLIGRERYREIVAPVLR